MIRHSCLLLLAALFAASCTDELQEATPVAAGRNIYSPTLVRDGDRWLMWYSGWQDTADLPNDRIYLRISADGAYWGEPRQVLAPADTGIAAHHVGDPSVTLEQDGATGRRRFTMFYTVCRDPCRQTDNEIWSSISDDGINWRDPRLLLAGDGAGEPSAIIDPSSEGRHWRVYFGKRVPAFWNRVHMLAVDTERRPMARPRVVHKREDGAMLGNPEVRRIGGSWQLFYNAYLPPGRHPFRYDVYSSRSPDNTAWDGAAALVRNRAGKPGAFCAATGPGVIAWADQQGYDLFFGNVIATQTGDCDLSRNHFISRWRFRLG